MLWKSAGVDKQVLRQPNHAIKIWPARGYVRESSDSKAQYWTHCRQTTWSLHLTNRHAEPFDRPMDVNSQTVLHDRKDIGGKKVPDTRAKSMTCSSLCQTVCFTVAAGACMHILGVIAFTKNSCLPTCGFCSRWQTYNSADAVQHHLRQTFISQGH